MTKERRSSPRVKCRFPCEIRGSKDRFAGIVLDVSEGGLAVQSQLEVEPGELLFVHLQLPHESKPLDLEATVWHARRTRHRQSGERFWVLGLMLAKAPDAYYELLPKKDSENPPASSAKPEARATEPESPRDDPDGLEPFRIRVRLRSEPRTRVLSLSAESEADARGLAVADLGDEWEVLEVYPAAQDRP